MKISSFIIAMVLVGLIMTGMGVYYARISSLSSGNYDESQLRNYEQFDKLNEQTKTVNRTINTIESDTGVVDILGGMLKSGYGVLKTTYYSVTIFNNMSNQAIDDAHLGVQTNNMKNAIMLIVAVIILFIIVGVVIGRDI